MKAAEVQWRLLRAERRALDGPKFTSPALSLARAIDRLRKLLIEQRAPRAKPVIRKRTIPIRLLFEAVEVHTETDGMLILSKATSRPRRNRTRRVVFLDSKPAPVIYDYAIDYYEKRIMELLTSVSIDDLSKALTKVEKRDFRTESAEEVVLEAYCRIFERNVEAIKQNKLDANHAEPESSRAVYKEIEAMVKMDSTVKLPWESTVDKALNRLELPTGRGKAGPVRGPRRKTSKKRT